ncbi:MAG TPA: VCBS repeat-containing protein [Pyrinomonadaceae bacterium]|nr:VCBS repeat-containing protein [Pyrinomonadaceae bacterium]
MKVKETNVKIPNILGNNYLLPNQEALSAILKRWRQKLSYFSMFAVLPAFLASQTQEVKAEETIKTEASNNGQSVRFLENLKNCRKPKLLQNRSNYHLPFEKGEDNLISEFTGGDDCPGNPIPGGVYTSAAPFTDSGDTTGANNTVSLSRWIHYCYYSYNAFGPDHIYSFTLTGRGANPQITVSTTSTTYRPMVYVLDGSNGGGCPSGTGNQFVCRRHISRTSLSPGGSAVLNRSQMNLLPLNTPLYLFIDSPNVGANDSGPYTIQMQDVSISPALPQGVQKRNDFDDDGKADISVFRPSDRTWYINRSTQGFLTRQFGLSDDKITPGNFDLDRKNDFAVFRQGTWYLLTSYFSQNKIIQFGLADDIPVPADYTGDGRDEIAVYRNGVWWIRNLVNDQVSVVQFGLSTDKPVPADYDGDGKTDQAVYRNGEWHLNLSTQGYRIVLFGFPSDKPVIGDYDGDGKTDLAVYRDGTWHILGSTDGYFTIHWGISSDIPVPDDYDGDGKTDVAVYRNGVWYLRQSTSGVSIQQFGLAGDKPIQSAFLP